MTFVVSRYEIYLFVPFLPYSRWYILEKFVQAVNFWKGVSWLFLDLAFRSPVCLIIALAPSISSLVIIMQTYPINLIFSSKNGSDVPISMIMSFDHDLP